MSNIYPMPGGCGFSEKVYERVTSLCSPSPRSVFELGCGNGGNLELFSSADVRLGVDPFVPNIEEAHALDRASYVRLGNHTELTELNTDQFDLGLTCSVIDHIETLDEVLPEFIRVCREIVLIEPYIVGQNRQALISETERYRDTWYHDYSSWLSRYQVEQGSSIRFSIDHCPLYSTNSGPLYHSIHICKVGEE